ncbi:exodeoxyribonuclease I [Gilvimarinus sp. SDUM040013]|uniref:Exodeoxyribonuclease I n=1 Tax=Gilvimarinus gilvus TaxID=3058038 RepID=A0ABU4RSZ0_9GAMM|nr:exodeoxyribonuclease I [Gilvimarinus sp. SDUM040013]MDO3387098.1 exodeoxyribonuclease I [Gilvimarinus sp. SDUM040013]MDX6848007.1 exodeoxyribonuclease I [Gilvimarinus sp. SDUM040013]
MQTFYWHDYETWGEVPAIDRPSQFAGVRTDLELNPIGEPLMIYCRPPEDLLPKPMACLVTGLTPQKAAQEGLSERDFIGRIHQELAVAGTCGVGYNSIRFDDEVTRYSLYRNFYDPYEREWKAGNSRWDIIDVVRMTRALRPEGIEWPNYDDGTPCFKLEALTAANNLEHGAAHDALSDVYATIALARLVKQRQPKLFEYAFKLRNKQFVGRQLDIETLKPVLHISSMFPSAQGNCALMVPLAYHPKNKNSVIAFNLAQSPKLLLDESPEALAERLFVASKDLPEGTERLALKEIHLNKSPMVLPVAMLDESVERRLGLDRTQCERHWQEFKSLTLVEMTALRAKLAQLYQMSRFEPRTDVDAMLYDGFLDDHDKALARKVRDAAPATLASGQFDFHDERLAELLWRYRARNFPATLSENDLRRWRQFCRQRLTDPAAGADLVIEGFESELARMQSECSAKQQRVLQAVNEWGQGLLAQAQT